MADAGARKGTAPWEARMRSAARAAKSNNKYLKARADVTKNDNKYLFIDFVDFP